MGMVSEGPVRFLIFSDPPDHTKLRRLVNRPFTPSNIAKLEPRARQIAEQLVDEMIAANEEGRADLIHDLGAPLPVTVISWMLGIPPERRHDFKRWSDDMLGGTSPDFDIAGAAQSSMEMFSYFGEVAEQRAKEPGDDLISMLVSGPEALNTGEVLMFCMLLLIAGNETTTNLIGNGALALFAHPDEARRLQADPGLLPLAIEECLRYDAPVQTLGRTATRAVTIEGVTIPAGGTVMPLYGSANRDPRHYGPDAHVLRLDRNPTDHLAFGGGIHYCLGAALARMEARVAGEVLLRRVRSLRPTGPVARVHNPIVRGLRSLPIAFAVA
jgi:cytochrome P450